MQREGRVGLLPGVGLQRLGRLHGCLRPGHELHEGQDVRNVLDGNMVLPVTDDTVFKDMD